MPLNPRLVLLLSLLAACADEKPAEDVAPTASITDPASGGTLPAEETWTLRGMATDPSEPVSRLRARWLVGDVVVCDSAAPAADGTTTCAWSTGEAGERAIRLEVSDAAGNVASAEADVTVAAGESGVPTCGITAPVDGGAGAEGSAVELAAVVGDVGADGLDHLELLSIQWSSDQQGLLGTSVADAAGSVTFTTTELWSGTHVLALRATDLDGNVCADAVMWTVGAPPAVTITDPLDGDVVDEGAPVMLAGYVEDDGDLPDTLWVRWESDRDGVLSEGPPDQNGDTALVTAALSRGEHHLGLTATDPLGLESTAWVTLTVNGAPTAPTVSLSPATPTTDDALVATITSPSVDPDGDALLYTYAWSRFGVASTASTTDTLPASATTGGDEWRVDVTASDGRTSSPVGSASVVIGNSAPVIASVSLSPASVRTEDEVTAVVSASDPDGDALTLTYDWYVDGALVQSGGPSTLAGVLWFDRDQEVVYTVTASDGSLSDSATSVPVTVENSPPTAPEVAIAPEDPVEGDALTCAVTAASRDPDGDPVTYTFSWESDGASYTGARDDATSSIVDGADVLDGQVWTCVVTPDDGIDAGSTDEDTVGIGGEPPPESGVNLLVNPGLETGDFTGWTLTADGGNGWAISETGLTDSDFGVYATRTSYSWCARMQVVDLVAAGYSEADLDAAPTINVSDWFRERYDRDEYYVGVTLLDASGGTIDEWSVSGTTSGAGTWDDDAFFEVAYSFSGYGAGVRFVQFEDGGQDTEWWAGNYGIEIDNAFVGVELP